MSGQDNGSLILTFLSRIESGMGRVFKILDTYWRDLDTGSASTGCPAASWWSASSRASPVPT